MSNLIFQNSSRKSVNQIKFTGLANQRFLPAPYDIAGTGKSAFPSRLSFRRNTKPRQGLSPAGVCAFWRP